jgi:hypothetical protein
MRPSGLALLAFCLAAIVGALHWLPRQTSEGFLLKVTLIDPAARTEIQTRIETQKPFECMETHKGGKITIRGELSSKRKGSYHLRITIVEWASETSSSTENFEMDLVPGAAVSRCLGVRARRRVSVFFLSENGPVTQSIRGLRKSFQKAHLWYNFFSRKITLSIRNFNNLRSFAVVVQRAQFPAEIAANR